MVKVPVTTEQDPLAALRANIERRLDRILDCIGRIEKLLNILDSEIGGADGN